MASGTLPEITRLAIPPHRPDVAYSPNPNATRATNTRTGPDGSSGRVFNSLRSLSHRVSSGGRGS
ncbi:hypothetical protein JCM9957A_38610 [Kineosporia succinea]